MPIQIFIICNYLSTVGYLYSEVPIPHACNRLFLLLVKLAIFSDIYERQHVLKIGYQGVYDLD